MNTINIKKFSTKLQQYIIKEVPDAKSINYEGESMSSKPPKWFEDFYKEFVQFRKEVNQRLDVIEQDIKDMKNTPTMKKELAIS